ncbi:hypothetical protein CEK25_012794 [Fusarium fujikuroi]|nr:hypothetical protein CEK25_012794 [Fusarium fujikuroi]
MVAIWIMVRVIWIILRTFMLTFRCVYTCPVKLCYTITDKVFLATITTQFFLGTIISVLSIILVFSLRLRLRQQVKSGAMSLVPSWYHPISRPSNAIKLTTLIRTNKDREADETSSTHQLADVENGLHYHSGDGSRSEGVHTMISSEQSGSGPEFDTAGIHVRNDTVVEIKQVENKGFYRLE